MYVTGIGWLTRRRIAIAVVALVLTGSLTVLVLLATQGSRIPNARPTSTPLTYSPPASAANRARSTPPTVQPSSIPPAALPALPRTDDPVVYAREVADALFGVSPGAVTRDQFLRFWRGELPTVVYSDGAAKGLTLAVQNQDAINNLTTSWIPPQGAWTVEAQEHTVNSFQITAVSVPDYWIEAVANGTFRDPGLQMERVMGVLTQTYGGDPGPRATAARPVIIDLVLLCGPTQPGGCRLLAPQQTAGAGDAATG